jgi:hypothetical protein
VDALTSADSTVVLQAIRTLWNIGDEQTCAKRLLVLQEHQDDEIQREAMRLLEHLTGDTGYRALVRRPTNLVSRDTPFDDARYESPKTISVLGPGRHL